MKAIGYVRVSSVEQVAEGISLELQAERITAYCKEKGWFLVKVVRDAGISGGDRARYARMLETAKESGASRVVVYHFDRFGRDVSGTLEALRAWTKKGIELHVVGRGRIEVETSSGFLQNTVEQMVAEHFRRIISEKTKDAKAKNKAEGKWNGGCVPFGYMLACDRTRLIEKPDEQKAIRLILRLRRMGLSLREVAARVNAEGFRTKAGRSWKAVQVANVIRFSEEMAA